MEGDLFDILSMDERIIVLSCVDERRIYTWNQSSTLQCWVASKVAGKWEETAVRTLSYQPRNYDTARCAAQKWYLGQ